jgi:hypothetical protein
MRETGTNTGVFTGGLVVAQGMALTVEDGILSLLSTAETITCTYKDMSPSLTTSVITKPSTAGVVNILPTLIGSGVGLTVTVSDVDLNVNTLAADMTSVLVFSDRQGEGIERLVLTETGLNTGIFTGGLRTVRSGAFTPADDGVLNIQPGTCDNACSTCATGGCRGFVTVSYADVSPWATLRRYAAIGNVGSVTACVAGQPVTDFCTFDAGQLFVTVTHPNLNTLPTTIQQVHVHVCASESRISLCLCMYYFVPFHVLFCPFLALSCTDICSRSTQTKFSPPRPSTQHPRTS